MVAADVQCLPTVEAAVRCLPTAEAAVRCRPLVEAEVVRPAVASVVEVMAEAGPTEAVTKSQTEPYDAVQ